MNPQIMQATGNFHHQVREAILQITEGILDDPTAFDARYHMLYFDPESRNEAIEKEGFIA
jgi:hypothetical protein